MADRASVNIADGHFPEGDNKAGGANTGQQVNAGYMSWIVQP